MMDRDDALDYRMLYKKAHAEIERLRAALQVFMDGRISVDRAAIIEECARVAESYIECLSVHYDDVATAIRALKGDKT